MLQKYCMSLQRLQMVVIYFAGQAVKLLNKS